METFVIGDIEDSPQAFRDACECITNHPNARFIFLGDIYHPHTSSETIANAETILNLLGIRIRQFFLEGVTLEPAEHRHHSERITQAFRDLYLQKELEKYTPTDKIRFQIFTSDKPLKDKSNEDNGKNEGKYRWKEQRKYFNENFNHGYAQSYSYSDKNYSTSSEYENNTTSISASSNNRLNNDSPVNHSSNIETIQAQEEVYNATRSLRLNCEYKLWREVQEDEDGPIFLFGNKEIDLMRDLAELNMAAVDSQGTIYYNIDYFRNKRRKTISQSLTIHEINVLLTYLSLCEDAVVIGKTLFTHIYVNARQIYYHAHQFNTTYDASVVPISNEISTYEHNRMSLNGAQINHSFSGVQRKPLPSLEAKPSYYKAASIDETHSSVNYYMNKHYTIENKRFIHVVVGHSKCFGSFFDPEHLEIQITMLDITGDTSFDPEHPHGRTGPVEIGFKNYIKFTPCSSNENKSLVAHIIFNSTDPIIQEMLKFKFPAKQLFLTSKPSPLISVIDFYRARRDYYLQKLEARNVQKNVSRTNSNSEDSESFQKQLHASRSIQPTQSAYELGSWRNSSHQRASSENIGQIELKTVEHEHIIQRHPSICLAEMDIEMDKYFNANNILKNIQEIKSEPIKQDQNLNKTQIHDDLSGNSILNTSQIDLCERLNSIEESAVQNSSEQPYMYKHVLLSNEMNGMKAWQKEKFQPLAFTSKPGEKFLGPMQSVKFNENLNTRNTINIDNSLIPLRQMSIFNKPCTFNMFEEHKSDSISNDTSSHNESAPSESSQEEDIKPDSISNETPYSSSDEDLPSSLKLKKTFDLRVSMVNTSDQAEDIDTFT